MTNFLCADTGSPGTEEAGEAGVPDHLSYIASLRNCFKKKGGGRKEERRGGRKKKKKESLLHSLTFTQTFSVGEETMEGVFYLTTTLTWVERAEGP